MSNHARVSAIHSVERRLLDAQVKGDRIALMELLSDDYVGTNPDGSRVNKSQEIDNLMSSGYSSGEIVDVSVQTHGQTSIAVGYLIMSAGDRTHRYSFTDVFVKEKLVACQAVLV